jgi:hypothetical protein
MLALLISSLLLYTAHPCPRRCSHAVLMLALMLCSQSSSFLNAKQLLFASTSTTDTHPEEFEAPSEAVRKSGEALVGRIIRIYWEGKDEKYLALVTRFNEETRSHSVRYINDDERSDEKLEDGSTYWELFITGAGSVLIGEEDSTAEYIPRRRHGGAGATGDVVAVAVGAGDESNALSPLAATVTGSFDIEPSAMFPSLGRTPTPKVCYWFWGACTLRCWIYSIEHCGRVLPRENAS